MAAKMAASASGRNSMRSVSTFIVGIYNRGVLSEARAFEPHAEVVSLHSHDTAHFMET